MSQAEKRTQETGELAREGEVAGQQADRIKRDFSYLDKQALSEANEEPTISEYAKGLQGQLDGAQKLLQDLRQSVMSGDHLSGDIDKKVKIEQMLDDVRYKVHHAFAKPTGPDSVAYQQKRLENAGNNFQQRFVKQAETMNSALNGEQSPNEKYPGEMAKKFDVDNVRRVLSADKLSELKTQVSSTLDRLKELQPQIEKIAQEKALKPEEKDEYLKNYGTMYAEYDKVKTELEQVLKDVEAAKR